MQLTHPVKRVCQAELHEPLKPRDDGFAWRWLHPESALLTVFPGSRSGRLQPHDGGLPVAHLCSLLPQLHRPRPIALVGPQRGAGELHGFFMQRLRGRRGRRHA
ncbi:MAG: hypothetical protein IIZ92_04765, partial [Aquincola sp.]|nr:hypothetical protein [Aquincola sp.]